MTRRDKCYFVARRAALLSRAEAAEAWFYLAGEIDGMGEMDVPKFAGLLQAVRGATIQGRQFNRRDAKRRREEA